MDHAINNEQTLQAERHLAGALVAFTGEWVAVRDHTVVHHAESLRQLLANAEEIDTIDRIFEVPRESGLACFF